MQVVMQPQGVSYGRMLDSTLWSPILAELTKLSIVAQQPLQARTYFNAPSFKQEMEEWMEWLRAILQYIAHQLPSSCIVEADDDDRKGTSTPMRDCLPSGYRKYTLWQATSVSGEMTIPKSRVIGMTITMTMTLTLTLPDLSCF